MSRARLLLLLVPLAGCSPTGSDGEANVAAGQALVARQEPSDPGLARAGRPHPSESPGLEPAPGVAGKLAAPFLPDELREVLRLSPLPPPPPDPTNHVADDPAAARLGQALFFDPRLSGNGKIACVTCHLPEAGLGDGRSLAKGIEEVRRHAPTLFNVAYHRWFFWDGRRDSLWSQAPVPLEHPFEMAGNRIQLARLIGKDDELRAAYTAVFGPPPDVSDPERFPKAARPVPDDEEHAHGGRALPEHEHEGVHPYQAAWDGMAAEDREVIDRLFTNAAKALAAYQRRLVSRDAPFDRFVEGLRTGNAEDLAALDASAQRGLRLFIGRGNCVLCHSGPAFTDLEFHNVLVPPLNDQLPEDSGRYAGIREVIDHPFRATSAFSDAPYDDRSAKIDYLVDGSGRPDHGAWGQFKTPSLRHVAETAPYMHQGQLPDLRSVLEHYSTHADAPAPRGHIEVFFKPLHLDEQELADLEAFLRSLTGAELDPVLLRAPR